MDLRSSDLEPERLRRLLNDEIARDQAREFRRYFLVRFAIVGVLVWVFSWPVPLLPHTVLWALAAAVVFAYGLMSPPSRGSTPDTRSTPPR
jgi:fatty acid desaturase